MTEEITVKISRCTRNLIERQAEETGSTLEAAADVLKRHFEAEGLRKEILNMSNNARKLLKILANSEDYVPRTTLVEELDIKNDRGLAYVLGYMVTYSVFGISDIIEFSPAGLRLQDHLREVVRPRAY